MARLIPALCPQCGGQVTLNPALEWVTCTFCRATSFVETPARRQAPNHPPPHVQVIQVPQQALGSTGISKAALVSLVLVFLLVPAVPIVLATTGAFVATSRSNGDRGAGSPTAATTPQVDYLRDASSLAPLLRTNVGADPQILGLHISASNASFDVALTPALDAFDTVDVNSGAVSRRAPMLIPPKAGTARGRTVRLSQIQLGLIPKLIADAQARLAIPGGKVVNVSIDSTHLPARVPATMQWRTRPHWVVLIRNERHQQGQVAFDLAGTHLKTQ